MFLGNIYNIFFVFYMKIGVYVFIQVDKGEPWKIADQVSKIEGIEKSYKD